METALANASKKEVTIRVNGETKTEERTLSITKAPKVLLIHEKRVTFDRNTQTIAKDNTPMTFPQELWIESLAPESPKVATETDAPMKEKPTMELTQAIKNAQTFIVQGQRPYPSPHETFFPYSFSSLFQALTGLCNNARQSAKELYETMKHSEATVQAVDSIQGRIHNSLEQQPMYAQFPFSFETHFYADLDIYKNRMQSQVEDLKRKYQETTQAIGNYETILKYMEEQQQRTHCSPKQPPLQPEETVKNINDLTVFSHMVQQEEEQRRDKGQNGTASSAVPQEKKSHKYLLFGVWVHKGTVNSGHYFACIKDIAKGKWFEMNDARVQQLTGEDVEKNGEGRVTEQQNASYLVYVSEEFASMFSLSSEQETEKKQSKFDKGNEEESKEESKKTKENQLETTSKESEQTKETPKQIDEKETEKVCKDDTVVAPPSDQPRDANEPETGHKEDETQTSTGQQQTDGKKADSEHEGDPVVAPPSEQQPRDANETKKQCKEDAVVDPSNEHPTGKKGSETGHKEKGVVAHLGEQQTNERNLKCKDDAVVVPPSEQQPTDKKKTETQCKEDETQTSTEQQPTGERDPECEEDANTTSTEQQQVVEKETEKKHKSDAVVAPSSEQQPAGERDLEGKEDANTTSTAQQQTVEKKIDSEHEGDTAVVPSSEHKEKDCEEVTHQSKTNPEGTESETQEQGVTTEINGITGTTEFDTQQEKGQTQKDSTKIVTETGKDDGECELHDKKREEDETVSPPEPVQKEKDPKNKGENAKSEDHSPEETQTKPRKSTKEDHQTVLTEEEEKNCEYKESSVTPKPVAKYLEGLKEIVKTEFMVSFCDVAVGELKKYFNEQSAKGKKKKSQPPQDFVHDKRMLSLENFLSQFTSKDDLRFQRLLVARVLSFALKQVVEKQKEESHSTEIEPDFGAAKKHLQTLMECDEVVESEARENLAKMVAVSREIEHFMKEMCQGDSCGVCKQLEKVFRMNKSLPKACAFTLQLETMGQLFLIRPQKEVTQDGANLLVSVLKMGDCFVVKYRNNSATPRLFTLTHSHHHFVHDSFNS